VAAPGIIPGWAFEADHKNANAQRFGARAPIGVFGEMPGSTPKYARNRGTEQDFRETMARMFIQIGPNEYTKFVNSVPEESRALASVLAGPGGTPGRKGGAGYIDFLLQSAQHGLQEKFDVTEVLSDNYVAYFFGQQAPTFAYSANLINSYQDDQAMNMLRIYRDMGRGSQLARRSKLVRLRYDSLIVAGVMTNLQWNLAAENEMVVPASWNLLVKSLTLLPNDKAGIVTLNDPFADVKLLELIESSSRSQQPIRLGGTSSIKPPTASAPTTENRTTGPANARDKMRATTA
jgi:hypothetical protein